MIRLALSALAFAGWVCAFALACALILGAVWFFGKLIAIPMDVPEQSHYLNNDAPR